MSGAASMPVNVTYMTNAPSVILPARMSCPPISIMITPTTPTTSADSDCAPETPVMLFATFRSKRWAPRVNTRCSRRSAVYALTTRMPPTDSARRPVTSAWIFPRSRNSGRSVRNA